MTKQGSTSNISQQRHFVNSNSSSCNRLLQCCSFNSTRLPCLDLGQVNFSPLRPFIALCRLTQMWVWWSPETGMFSASAWKNIPEGCDMARPCKTYLGILRQSIFSTCGHLHAIMCTICSLDICNMWSFAWRFIAMESQSSGHGAYDFRVKFISPLFAWGNLVITRASGGRWRFDLKLEATEPEVRTGVCFAVDSLLNKVG